MGYTYTNVANVRFKIDGAYVEESRINHIRQPEPHYVLTGFEEGKEYQLEIELDDADGTVIDTISNSVNTSAAPAEEDLVDIQDSVLLTAVQKEAGIYHRSVTYGELAHITSLTIEGDVTDLSPLQYAATLRSLTFKGTKVTSKNLEQLQLNTSLKYSSFYGTEIAREGIADLAANDHLIGLSFLNVNLDDWSFLSSMDHLSNLDLQDTNFRDARLLPPNLKNSYLVFNRFENGDALLTRPFQQILVAHPKVDEFFPEEIREQLEANGAFVMNDDLSDSEQILTVESAASNQITLSWKNEQNRKTTIKVNDQVMATVSDSTYTLTNLTPESDYFIEVFIEDEPGVRMYGFADAKTTAAPVESEDTDSPAKTSVEPIIPDSKVTVDDQSINKVETNGIAHIPAEVADDKPAISVQLSNEQLGQLIEKEALIEIERGDVIITVPAKNLEKGSEVKFSLARVEDSVNAIAPVYSFEITQGESTVSTFSEPVTLTFKVDESKVTNPDNVNAYYYNPVTKEWENIGGSYANGMLTVQTSHFSTYTVFDTKPAAEVAGPSDDSEEPQNNESPATVTPVEGAENGSTTGNGSTAENAATTENASIADNAVPAENGSTAVTNAAAAPPEAEKELPKTATPAYNYLLIGILLIVAGSVIFIFRKRKFN